MDWEILQHANQTEKTKSLPDFSGEKVGVDSVSFGEMDSVMPSLHRTVVFALAEHD